MGFFKEQAGSSDRKADPVFLDLRSNVLRLQATDVGKADGSDAIYGVLMETGFAEGCGTFVCLADGTVSLYTSAGGGVIGLGEHESVRNACAQMLSWTNGYAQEFMNASQSASEYPLPKNGAVFFYLLTTGGVYLARCSEAKLSARQDPFSNLFMSCQRVMTEARQVSQRLQGGE